MPTRRDTIAAALAAADGLGAGPLAAAPARSRDAAPLHTSGLPPGRGVENQRQADLGDGR